MCACTTQPEVFGYSWGLIIGPEWWNCVSAACRRSQSEALDSGSIMLGKGRRRNKGLARKGCSGLIESFGSSLH